MESINTDLIYSFLYLYISFSLNMQYEPGTIDCHVFLECKEQIEKMLLRLHKVENTEHICDQLQSIYQQIEGMHELKKVKRKKILSNQKLIT